MVDPKVLGRFNGKLEDVKVAVSDPFHEIKNDIRFRIVQPPDIAYRQAFEALDRLKLEFEAWRDLVEVVRGLQRSLLELLAFADWWLDIKQGDAFHSPSRAPTRGAIFEDEHLYANHARWKIVSYLLVPNHRFIPDPKKRVSLSPRKSSLTDVMSTLPLVHSLHLWYYPPHVENVFIDFETTARGFGDRLDKFTPTEKFKRKLDKLENRRLDEGRFIFRPIKVAAHDTSVDGRRAKRTKSVGAKLPGPSNNQELRRLVDAKAPPAWYPKQLKGHTLSPLPVTPSQPTLVVYGPALAIEPSFVDCTQWGQIISSATSPSRESSPCLSASSSKPGVLLFPAPHKLITVSEGLT